MSENAITAVQIAAVSLSPTQKPEQGSKHTRNSKSHGNKGE